MMWRRGGEAGGGGSSGRRGEASESGDHHARQIRQLLRVYVCSGMFKPLRPGGAGGQRHFFGLHVIVNAASKTCELMTWASG